MLEVVDIGNARIHRRVPVLTDESAKGLNIFLINQQWQAITGFAQRALLPTSRKVQLAGNRELRRILLTLSSETVSETLPARFLEELSLSTDQQVAQMGKRYKLLPLGEYLKIPPIPDSQLQPDIMHSDTYQPSVALINNFTIRSMVENALKRGINPDEMLHRYSSIEGVTNAERQLVLNRYRMARDIKILSFGAELAEYGLPQPIRMIDRTYQFMLRSGIQIRGVYDPLDPRILFDTVEWIRRTPLKDRVWQVTLEQHGPLLLKERKTNRHRDTRDIRDRIVELQTNASSAEEFEHALALQHVQQVQNESGITLAWEQPIAVVSFPPIPNGFSFCLFKAEANLQAAVTEKFTPNLNVRENLSRAILNASRHGYRNYETEYAGIQKVLANQKIPLSFNEYARVKAAIMLDRGREIYWQTLFSNGYTTDDSDGFSYKILPNGSLQVFGYDFEYYKKLSSQEATQRLLYHKEQTQEAWLNRSAKNLHYIGPRPISAGEEATFKVLVANILSF